MYMTVVMLVKRHSPEKEQVKTHSGKDCQGDQEKKHIPIMIYRQEPDKKHRQEREEKKPQVVFSRLQRDLPYLLIEIVQVTPGQDSLYMAAV
jgi:hypothetical protein